jgi:RNA polymerase sigma factor (sigma-70 family)
MGVLPPERALWLARHILPHEPALRAWLRRRTAIDLDIDDVVQEAYARLATLETVADIRNPKNYLFQTAYSVIATHFRRSRVVSIRAMNEMDASTIMADEPSPERHVQDREELQNIATAIATMPETCRRVFILRRVEGLSQRDVAARLGLTENSVEHHMANGIRFLLDLLGRGGIYGPRSSMTLKRPARRHEPARNKRKD